MKLSHEQIEACRKLSDLVVGELSDEESSAIIAKIQEGDQLYAALWKRRGGFAKELLLIDEQSEVDDEHNESSESLESQIARIAKDQFDKPIQDLSLEEKKTIADDFNLSFEDVVRATIEPPEFKLALRDQGIKHGVGENEFQPSAINQDSDQFRELADFLDKSTVRTILRLFGGSRQTLMDWIGEEENEYQVEFITALIENSLYKQHRLAIEHANRCVHLAVDSADRIYDAKYLRGRCNWYLNADVAVEDLQEVKAMAEERQDHTRQAQAAYYLARIANKTTKLSKGDFETLLNEAADQSKLANRTDIELLVTRAKLIHLRLNGKAEEGIRLAEKYLVHRQEYIEQGNFRIMGNFLVDYALLLRRRFTEEARSEAEEIYNEQIAEHRDDQHAGMCRYLKADLYVDRMIEGLKLASTEADGDARVAAEGHRNTALSLCLQARELLVDCGDTAALRKANGRIVALKNQALPGMESSTDVMEDHFARQSRITELFLGAAPADGGGSFKPGRNGYTVEEFDFLLSEFFDGVFVAEHSSQQRTRKTADYLRDDTMLCLPWRIGNTMVVRVFRIVPDSKIPVKNVGWFNLEQYSSATHDAVNSLLQLEDSVLLAQIPAHFTELQSRVHTVDAMTTPEKGALEGINHVLIVSPRQNEDWYCPIEWFRTDAENDQAGRSLLDMARKSVSYITPVSKPFGTYSQTVSNRQATVVVTTQVLGEAFSRDTIADLVKSRLDSDIELLEWDIDRKFEYSGNGPCYIVGHNDEQGIIEKAIGFADLGAPPLVGLVFCSSSRYRAMAGPFVDSLPIQLLDRYTGTKVLTSRIPVDINEAIRFLDFLLSYDSFDPRSLVCRYLKLYKPSINTISTEVTSQYNPFLLPWLAIV